MYGSGASATECTVRPFTNRRCSYTHFAGVILVLALGTGWVPESNRSSNSLPIRGPIWTFSPGPGRTEHPTVASHSGYSLYRNPRFGFSILHPINFRALRAPDNGDGLLFVSPDGLAKLTVSGANQFGESSYRPSRAICTGAERKSDIYTFRYKLVCYLMAKRPDW
jgi:hypothetical protein